MSDRKPLNLRSDGPPLAVLVTGSRHWACPEPIHEDLEAVYATGRLWAVIEGDAKGADKIAGRGWASKARHRKPAVAWLSVPADWERYKRPKEKGPNPAGPIRNRQMLDWLLQCPEVGVTPIVFAYPCPGSRGTRDMMTAVSEAGVRVVVRSEP